MTAMSSGPAGCWLLWLQKDPLSLIMLKYTKIKAVGSLTSIFLVTEKFVSSKTHQPLLTHNYDILWNISFDED